MAVKIEGRYLGNKKIELVHGPSGAVIRTAAPLDNQGDGSSFSPTDLFTASLGACMMTVMAIVAERDGIDLSGMRMEMEKHMEANPRRVGRIPLAIHMPSALSADQRRKMEASARACPVHHSVSADIKIELQFIYDA